MRQMSHENVNPFLGACFDSDDCFILMGLCSRGSLQDILNNEDIKLDNLFKVSLAMDVIKGLQYIHSSDLYAHGNLTSDSCQVDNRWMVKLSSYGIQNLRQNRDEQSTGEVQEYQHWKGLFWTAPELLRIHPQYRPRNGSRKGDIYSFGIIMYEIIHRCLPYDDSSLEPGDIVKKIQSPCGDDGAKPFRPNLGHNGLEDEGLDIRARHLMERCWDEEPLIRPSLIGIRKTLRDFNKGKNVNIMDNMLNMMEKYANNLEEIVQHRTVALMEEKKKTDTLLYNMLPKSVADNLKFGRTVIPESYDQVSIFFSDIVGFTELSSQSTPMEIVNLLNDLYTLCDEIIAEHDVYKVETIGDAYMVVSGLPERNGHRHASEIATMALDLLKAVNTRFVIKHRADKKMLLRIGLHTGPCVAGVVGLKMPRYCLFGDTVNVASRMESNGEPLKIHISLSLKIALDLIGGFEVTRRGELDIKGKGIVTTYWLENKADDTGTLSLVEDS